MTVWKSREKKSERLSWVNFSMEQQRNGFFSVHCRRELTVWTFVKCTSCASALTPATPSSLCRFTEHACVRRCPQWQLWQPVFFLLWLKLNLFGENKVFRSMFGRGWMTAFRGESISGSNGQNCMFVCALLGLNSIDWMTRKQHRYRPKKKNGLTCCALRVFIFGSNNFIVSKWRGDYFWNSFCYCCC